MSRVLALDPGLGSFGAALLDDCGIVLDADALATKPGDEVSATRAAKRAAKKLGKSAPTRRGKTNATVEQFDDRSRRVGEILSWLDVFAMGGDWIAPDVIVAEAGRAMGDVGTDGIISLATGSAIVSVFAWRYAIPVVWATQLEWRRVLIPTPRSGRHGVYEQAEIADAIGRDVERKIIERLRERDKSITIRDHALDAVGLGRWGVRCSLLVLDALGVRAAA